MKPIFYDCKNLSESQQIKLIGDAASSGKKAGFVLSNRVKKIDRFTANLKRRYPELTITRAGLLTPHTVAFHAERTQN